VECEEEEISTEEVHNICIIFDIAIDKNILLFLSIVSVLEIIC